MNMRSIIFALIVFQMAFIFAGEIILLPGLADAVVRDGAQYRTEVRGVLHDGNAEKILERILKQEPDNSQDARFARILVARIQHPEVFTEFDDEIRKWREGEKSSQPRGGRPGFLSGLLMQFTKRGPESRFIEEHVRDENNKIVFAPSGGTGKGGTLKAMRPVRRLVEKYTEAEVSAGIARNAAARQAVLEHFLKFLDEGDAYEQSEMVLLVNRLWGHGRLIRTDDLTVVDHVQDVDALLESVFQDRSRPMIARMSAVSCFPDAAPLEVQAFMLDVVTNTPPDDKYFQSESMVGTALYYLESSADANALVVLENQTNGPAWKREKIEKASRAIEGRLSAPLKDK